MITRQSFWPAEDANIEQYLFPFLQKKKRLIANIKGTTAVYVVLCKR